MQTFYLWVLIVVLICFVLFFCTFICASHSFCDESLQVVPHLQ